MKSLDPPADLKVRGAAAAVTTVPMKTPINTPGPRHSHKGNCNCKTLTALTTQVKKRVCETTGGLKRGGTLFGIF